MSSVTPRGLGAPIERDVNNSIAERKMGVRMFFIVVSRFYLNELSAGMKSRGLVLI